MKKNDKIISIWETETRHPSFGQIATKVGVNKSYVYRVIQKYLKGKAIEVEALQEAKTRF